MNNLLLLTMTDDLARKWVIEAANGKRRLFFSSHAEKRMKQRKIGRRQVLDCMKAGGISESVHRDTRGDWCCNVSGFVAGARITVGVAFKIAADGEKVVVLTIFEG